MTRILLAFALIATATPVAADSDLDCRQQRGALFEWTCGELKGLRTRAHVSRPTNPDRPGEPGKPGKPSKPGKPDKPDRPDRPSKPDRPHDDNGHGNDPGHHDPSNPGKGGRS